MRRTPDRFMASLPLPEVYRVGGSVRDELLSRRAKDADYMVRGANLGEIKDALVGAGAKPAKLQTRDGKQVGWRAAIRGLGLLEIVMPRTERTTGPGHADFEIIAAPDLTLEQDCTRRDFTINALYRDVRNDDVLDPTGRGLPDLGEGLIRTTHPDSFRDDPLRTLRALRFISKLEGFDLAASAFTQMSAHADAVDGLSAKGYASGTVLTELSGLLMGARPGEALRVARATGVLARVLPELKPMLGFNQRSRYHSKTTDQHTFDAVQAAANMHDAASLRVRWALLFHDSGKPDTAWTDTEGFQHYYTQPEDRDGKPALIRADHEVVGAHIARRALARMNAPKDLRRDVPVLIERHMLPLHQNIKPFKVRQWRAELGDELLHDLITHRVADLVGKGGDISEGVEVLAWVAKIAREAQAAGVPTSARELEIGGHDLLALGLEGRNIGEVQAQLLHEVLAQPKLNDREWLLKRAEALGLNAGLQGEQRNRTPNRS